MLKKFLCFLLLPLGAFAQLSGTLTVPGTYSTLAVALNALNAQGSTGGLTILVASTHTEVAPPKGFTISASGTLQNQIQIIGGTGLARALLLAPSNGTATPSSSVQDGIFRFIGADYVTLKNFELRDANTTAPQTMEFGISFFKKLGNDGCQNNKIINCRIKLSNLNNTAGNLPACDGARGIEFVNALATAHTSSLIVNSTSGAHSYNQLTGNYIEFCNYGIVAIGFADSAPYNFADVFNVIGGPTAAEGNTVVNFGGGGTNAAAGIRIQTQYNCLISYNTVLSNLGTINNHNGTLRGILAGAAANADITISRNNISLHSGATSSQLSAIDNQSGGAGLQNIVRICSNTISACSYSTASSGNFYALQNNASAASLRIDSNTIVNNSTGASSGSTFLIYNSGAVGQRCSISYNFLDMKFNGLAAYQGNFSVINSANSASSCAIAINSNTFANIIHSNFAGTGTLQFISQTADADSLSICNNIWRHINLNHAATNYIIQNMSAISSQIKVCGNRVSNYFRQQSGNTWFYYANSTANAAAVQTYSNNSIQNIRYLSSASGNITIFQVTDGGSSPYPQKIITTNTITGISSPNAGAFTGVHLSDIGLGPANSTSQIRGNLISKVSVADNCTGLQVNSPIQGGAALVVSQNTLSGLTCLSSAASVNGANVSAGGGAIEFSHNKICKLISTSLTGSATALQITTAGSYSVHHNLIADLFAPSTSGQNRVNGIYITTATQLKIFYNTIRLQAQSTGTVFGTNAIYCSSTPGLELRNNILINLSTSSGTAQTVALRRSSSSNTSYSLTSNNNVFYAGIPAAQNLLFYNGSAAYQTLTALQTALAPRENLSQSQLIPFSSFQDSSPYYLHLSQSTVNVAESAGSAISGYSLDYDMDIRQGNLGYVGSGTNPDCGADEAELSSLPCTSAASVSFSVLSATLCAGDSLHLFPNINANGSSIVYQWAYSANSNSYTAVSGGTLSEIVMPFLSAGTYLLKLNSTCAATNATATSSAFTLQVVAAPSISVSGSQTVCFGATATLQAIGAASSYYWFGPSAFTSTSSTAMVANCGVNSAGIYTLQTETNFCSLPTQTILLAIDPVSASVTANPPIVCNGGTSTLQAIGAAQSFVWNASISSSSIVVTPTSSTVYSVLALGSSSCSVTKTLQVAVVVPNIVVSNATVCLPQTTATLTINSFTPSTTTWFQSANAVWPSAYGNSINTSTNSNATWYVKSGLYYDKNYEQSVSVGAAVNMLMFDIQPSNNLLIKGFELPVLSSASCNITVYTRAGSFQTFSTTAAGWNLMGSASLSQLTTSTAAVFLNDDFYVASGQTSGIAIAVAGNSVMSSSIMSGVVGNSDLQVSTMQGGNLFATTQTTSNFHGKVFYARETCASPISSVQVQINGSPNVSISAASSTVCPFQTAILTASGAASYLWPNGASGINNTLTVLSPTVVSVTGYSQGCSAQASLALQVFTLVVPNVVAASASVCPNQSVMLTASGLASYTWNTGPNGTSAIVQPAIASTYTVFGHDLNLCFTSGTVAVGTKSVPYLSINTLPETYCKGETISLKANGALSYTWQPFGTGGSTCSAVASNSTAIVVVGSGINTCTNSSFIVLNGMSCTNTLDAELGEKMKLYPQPAHSFFTLEGNEIITSIALCNVSAQLLCQWKPDSKVACCNIENVPKGVYFIFIEFEGQQRQLLKLLKD